MTLQRLQQQPDFNNKLNQYVEQVSQFVLDDLNKCAQTPARAKSDEKRAKQLKNREKKLTDILKDAAAVYLEMLQEPANFQFFIVNSEAVFDGNSMKEAEVRLDESVPMDIELMAAPGLLKKKFGAQDSMVMMKAKIYMREIGAVLSTGGECVGNEERFADLEEKRRWMQVFWLLSWRKRLI